MIKRLPFSKVARRKCGHDDPYFNLCRHGWITAIAAQGLGERPGETPPRTCRRESILRLRASASSDTHSRGEVLACNVSRFGAGRWPGAIRPQTETGAQFCKAAKTP